MPVAWKLMAKAVGHNGAHQYQRRQPEQTQLYQLVERYFPAFRDLMANQGRRLPEYVQKEFEALLKCGRLEYGFLRVQCGNCQHERLVAFSCKKRGFCRGRPVPVAVPVAWPIVQHTWSMKYYRCSRFANGC